MNAPDHWLHQSPLLMSGKWLHGWTTSGGPEFGSDPASGDHTQSVDVLARTVGLDRCAWVRQVHGGRVLQVTEAGFAGEADALWSDQAGLGVVGRGADCPLILAGGTRTDGSRVWGFAHASWRSTLQGITAGLLVAMTKAGVEPANLQAVICPSAGPCCFEVGEEVREAALNSLGPGAAWLFLERTGILYFDLWAANISQLTAAGVSPRNIHCVQHCTICGGDLFPSFRREGDRAGRFAAVIGY